MTIDSFVTSLAGPFLYAGPQAIAQCQHPELHFAREDDCHDNRQLCDIAGRAPFLYFLLIREGLVQLCHQNKRTSAQEKKKIPVYHPSPVWIEASDRVIGL